MSQVFTEQQVPDTPNPYTPPSLDSQEPDVDESPRMRPSETPTIDWLIVCILSLPPIAIGGAAIARFLVGLFSA